MAASYLIILFTYGTLGAQMKRIADSWLNQLPDASFMPPDASLKDVSGDHQWCKSMVCNSTPCIVRKRLKPLTEPSAMLGQPD
jgi:hypothetical protein